MKKVSIFILLALIFNPLAFGAAEDVLIRDQAGNYADINSDGSINAALYGTIPSGFVTFPTSRILITSPGATTAGYGTTNTTVRRYANGIVATGTDITSADTAAAGTSINLVNAGYYCMSASDYNSGSSATFGFTLNGTHLTASIVGGTLGPLEVLNHMSTPGGSQTGSVNYCGSFASGDIIRVQAGGTGPNATDNLARIDVSRVR